MPWTVLELSHWLSDAVYGETWITRTAGDHQKSLSYEKYELYSPFALTRVMSHALTLL